MNYPVSLPRFDVILVSSALLWCTVGCGVGPTQVASGGVVNPPAGGGSALSTGNWQGQLIASAGKKPLGVISGSIDQSGGTTSGGQFTTSVFRIGAPCYANTPVPAQGFVKDAAVTLNSFAVEHQYLTLNGTVAAAGTSIDGTYVINGGCADGSSGSMSLQRYMPFTGTYMSAQGGVSGLTITVSQSDGADGSGAFPVVATAAFNNSSCFTDGTAMMSDSPYISGASFDLPLTTNERGGSTVHLTGTISVDATTVTQYAFRVTGGECDGTSGTGMLTRR